MTPYGDPWYGKKRPPYSSLKRDLKIVAKKSQAMIVIDAENNRRLRMACMQNPDKAIVDVAWENRAMFDVL